MPLRTTHRVAGIVTLAAFAALPSRAQSPTPSATRFEVTIAPAVRPEPLTGRLVLVIAKSDRPEPRLQISPSGPAIFGVALEGLPAGQPAVVDDASDDASIGYPSRLRDLPPGEYSVQAVINVYEQVRRADGKSIWVHINDGTIETFQVAAGNLYSDVQRVRVGNGRTVRITVTHVIPRSPRPVETEWVKRVSIQSEKLTKFWGRPIFVHATVLLPKGYAEHPSARYPVVYTLGHGVPFSVTTDSTRGRPGIDPRTGLENGYQTFKAWTADSFPRFIAISLEQQTPYFPDSYSINSANNGPYGDAIIEEVMPALERQFRAIGKPYARLLEGASTSGWQTLAMMLRHPDFFGGGWVLQPDPIDFRRYQLVNIYEDTNAFVLPIGQFSATERPFRRTTEGQVVWTVRSLSRFEDVLGSRGRSGYQLEAWEAIYGPVGSDGYPVPLWDKRTGTIDRAVANYMRENGYDLREYAQRNWTTLGPKLRGKLHFFCGDMDDFYLNLAVYQFEQFLKDTTNPHYEADFTYGRPMKGHSWHAWTWADMVRQMGAYVRHNAPAGENTTSWSY